MPKTSLVVLALGAFLCFSVGFVFLKNFQQHWMDRTERAARARLYLKTDVCTNHKLRIQMGPEATCAQKEMELRVTPLYRAIFDTLEDYSLCGHRRCEAMVQWVTHWKWLFLALGAVILWFYLQCFMFSFQVRKMHNFQQLSLPGSHLHVD